jgi:ring-1,2-phenylacetyl-CoA epoxidase subunit PaaC
MTKRAEERMELDAGWEAFALAWADDEILLAHIIGELLAGWSEVEDLIALGSIAQDDLAHATLVYSLVEPDPRERDRLFFERAPKDFRNSRLASLISDEWGVVIARQYLYELADRLRIEALLASEAPKPLLDIAAGIGPEEAAHRAHWEQWCETLARTDAGRERLEQGLAEVWPLAGDLLALPADCAELDWPREELEQQWAGEARAYFGGLGIAAPEEAPEAVPRPRSGKQPKAMLKALERSRRVYNVDTNAVWG